jgi:hypothetical protein
MIRKGHLAVLFAASAICGSIEARAAGECRPFTGFPLSINLGSGINTGSGESLNCFGKKVQDAFSTVGRPNGLAVLDGTGRLSASQLPNSVLRLDGSGSLAIPAGPTLGTYQNGKFTSQPDTIQIQGSSSTGDVSGMTVTPSAGATVGTLARMANDKLDKSALPTALDGLAVSSSRASSAYTGAPTTYTFLPAFSQGNYTFNSAVGYQQSYATDSGGRTLVAHEFLSGQHVGYGDYNGWFATIGVTAHPSVDQATSWTGRNSATVVGGAVGANTADANLYGMEYALGDNGKQSVAALGLVINHNRQATNARNYTAPWIGVRVQNPLSTVSSDALYQGLGSWKVGLDFTGANFGVNQTAIALNGGQRIYLNADATTPPSWFSGDGATSTGTSWIDFSGGVVRVVSGGQPILQLSSSFVTTSGQFNTATGYAISGVNVIDASRLVKLAPYTVTSLPTCNTANQDKLAVVTDATTPTYRGALTGGGSVRTPVYCNGSAWEAH